MNDNKKKNSTSDTSVNFINSDNDQQLSFKFSMTHHSETSKNKSPEFDRQRNKNSDHKDNDQNDELQKNSRMNDEETDNQLKSNESSPSRLNQTNSLNQIHSTDELESSSFCTINSNDKLDNENNTANSPTRTTISNPIMNSVINSRSAESYDFAIPLPYSEYKAPPKRSEFSSFMHSPLSKTLDTFSKLSNLLKEDIDERQDDLFFKPSLQNFNNENNPFNFEQIDSQRFPPPSLPEIEAKNPKPRLSLITELEYDTELKFKSKLFLFERIFLGGLESDSLRRRLWPILLGIMDDENEENWVPLTKLYNHYMMQWKSITPDQESRFTLFKENKSMMERDAVRCDRSHPYYQNEEHINILKDVLMCYIMHDFDTGYVQGMTDLAAPLLYVFEGDPVKTFWCFTGVLKLTKKNFEMEQTTVKNLLVKLFKLIHVTDPCFAEFLAEKDSDNCYFAFRWLICLFKREFVKGDNSYDQLLIVWDTLWAVHAYEEARKEEAQEEFKRQLNILKQDNSSSDVNSETTSDLASSSSNKFDLETSFGTSPPYIVQRFVNRGDFDDSNNQFDNGDNLPANKICNSDQLTKNQLTNFELFVLSMSLSIIRQERDKLFSTKYDSATILKHFNQLNLKPNLISTLKHATKIWCWLKYDCGEEQLYAENNGSKDSDDKLGGFDLLNDY